MPTRKTMPANTPPILGSQPLDALLVNTAEPAYSIIKKCGGVRPLARALSISPAAVTRWQKHRTPTDKRGCDGVIPEFRRSTVIAVARELGKRVTKAEFLKTQA